MHDGDAGAGHGVEVQLEHAVLGARDRDVPAEPRAAQFQRQHQRDKRDKAQEPKGQRLLGRLSVSG